MKKIINKIAFHLHNLFYDLWLSTCEEGALIKSISKEIKAQKERKK